MILIIGNHHLQELARIFHLREARHDVSIDANPGIDSHGWAVVLDVVTGTLNRVPGTFEK
jgi:hypothetical protein